ncbi:MAG: endolytic transglycosylase MltG [Campylobacteraceae bacterium]
MTRRKIGIQIFFIIFDIMLIMFISLIVYLAKPIKTDKILLIPEGSITKIISYLNEQNVKISPSIDTQLLKLIGSPQSGFIDMKSEVLSKGDYLYNLSHAKAAMQSITLIPGETNYIFLQDLSQNLNLSFELLEKYYNLYVSLEDGWFIPESYSIPIGMDEKNLILYLNKKAQKMHEDLSFELLGRYDKKEWERYLIIASIIQKEAANNSEMPLVSSVIYNRLDKGMKLQMDGTLNYGKYSHVKVTPKMIKEDLSKYNTYMHEGIPTSPVCAVSKNAIFAAVRPAKTDFLYFVRVKNGEHAFTKTYEEHIKNFKQ